MKRRYDLEQKRLKAEEEEKIKQEQLEQKEQKHQEIERKSLIA
jgi:hypothetical protein